MLESGTRVPNGRPNGRMPTGSINGRYSRDIGMKGRATGAMTMTAATGVITGPNNTQFRVYDVVRIIGTNLNNGFEVLQAVAGGSVTVWPYGVKDESPSNAEVRIN